MGARILVVVFFIISVGAQKEFSFDSFDDVIENVNRMKNYNPIIGVLAQETHRSYPYFPKHYESFIAASYVKFLEGAGARAIPIW